VNNGDFAMRRINLGASIFATALAALVTFATGDARSQSVSAYQGIPQDQAEFITSEDRIKNIGSSGSSMAIWEALEHAERVECMGCVSTIAPLLYDQNAQTREIAAWWLRRRIFGVFGPGEVYQQTMNTLAQDGDPTRRANAAYALGEFLVTPGIQACATALAGDSDARVRVAAASALSRLNDDGAGALSRAFSDGDESVRLASLRAAGRINAFTDTAAASKALGDNSPSVRRRAVNLLDEMHAKDSVAGVLALAQHDADADVRLAACHDLGNFHDPSVRAALTDISTKDGSSLVRDIALIALRTL
jgi:hypothetical protein